MKWEGYNFWHWCIKFDDDVVNKNVFPGSFVQPYKDNPVERQWVSCDFLHYPKNKIRYIGIKMDFLALLMSKRVNLLPISLLVNLVVVCIDFWFKMKLRPLQSHRICIWLILVHDWQNDMNVYDKTKRSYKLNVI